MTLRHVKSLLLLGIALPACSALAQQEFANRATGVRSESLYAVSGSDEINVFNGNLAYRIPFGAPISVGPVIQLGAMLAYNGHHGTNWILESYNAGAGGYTYASEMRFAGDRVVGLGWQLHFGRLISLPGTRLVTKYDDGSSQSAQHTTNTYPSLNFGMYSTGLGYQSPDGSVHTFYNRLVETTDAAANAWGCDSVVSRQTMRGQGKPHCYGYTHDGSFLRIDPRDPDYGNNGTPTDYTDDVPVIYFPDGTVYVLGFRGGRYPVDYPAYRSQDLDFAADQAPWNVTRIADLNGNAIDVIYYGGPGGPGHPLADKPLNEQDVIPYRAQDAAQAGTRYIEFGYTRDDTYTDDPIAWISSVSVPSPVPNGYGYYQRATYQLGYQYLRAGSTTDAPVPGLTSLLLPSGDGYTFGYLGAGPPLGIESSYSLNALTMPTGGTLAWQYESVRMYRRDPTFCYEPFATNPACPGFTIDDVWGVKSRTATRYNNGVPELGTTTYVRSYPAGTTCSSSQPIANCQLRVDVWQPQGSATSVNVTRTTFHASDGTTNKALYGRPLSSNDYFVPPTTPNSATIDGYGAGFRTTQYTYEYDGAINAAWDDHNTREQSRTSTMNGLSAAQTESTTRFNWDGLGHYTTINAIETAGGTTRTLRTINQVHLNSVGQYTPGGDVAFDPYATCTNTFSLAVGFTQTNTEPWLLSPVLCRGTSRPAETGDPANANLSTTERFTIDASGFIKQRLTRADDQNDSRVLTTNWTKGTSAAPPCRYQGGSSTECDNRGLPIQESAQLTGNRTSSVEGTSTPYTATGTLYQRVLYYQFGTLAAAYDEGTDFYSVDRTITPSAHVQSERGPEGRDTRTGSPQLTTTYSYDILGRVTQIAPPGENTTDITYTSNTIVRRRSTDSTTKTFFDGLGRPIVELRQVPGATPTTTTAYTYRVTTYDAAGRRVSLSEWQPTTCTQTDPCPGLASVQATISGGTIAVPVGTVFAGWDHLGRPTITQHAYNSSSIDTYVADTYTGWRTQDTTRTFNSINDSATTTITRDALGRIYSVTEPAVGGGSGDTTRYWYDANDRLIKTAKPWPTGTIQARSWQYDDFGWLVREQTPEIPVVEYLQRDARGNPTEIYDGARISKTYDLAGRLLTSARSTDTCIHPPTGNCNSTRTAITYEEFAYDHLPELGLTFGSSNGRLVRGIRHNRGHYNNYERDHQPPDTFWDGEDFGWIDVQDLYHYNAPAGRLSLRQMTSYLIDGNPVPSGRASLAGNGNDRRNTLGFAQYFETSGRHARNADDVTRTARDDSGHGGGSGGGNGNGPRSGRAALVGDPYNPSGWFRWRYDYDNVGRISKITYPRRDDEFATDVTYTYTRGWLTRDTATIRDPFLGTTADTIKADFTYNPSGTTSLTTVTRGSSSTPVLRIATPDDANNRLPRPASWSVTKGSSQTPYETRIYSYDRSGNITSAGADSFQYDARARLQRDVPSGGQPKTYGYDTFGNLTTVFNEVTLDNSVGNITVDPSTNRFTSAPVTYAPGLTYTTEWDNARGLLKRDGVRNVWRDWYADGRPATEFQPTMVYPSEYASSASGMTINLYDSSAEREMHYFGVLGDCEHQLSRHTIRDLSNRPLTDYKARNQGNCACDWGNPCIWSDVFEQDHITLGPYATVTYKGNHWGGAVTRYYALDHLGTPRLSVTSAATVVASPRLEPFGTELTCVESDGTPITRERFTGHERDHVLTDERPNTLSSPVLPFTDHMHARTYVPILGRFTAPDTFRRVSGNPQSSNRYSYVGNNPVNRLDPDGRNWFDITGKGWQWAEGDTLTINGKNYTSPYTHLLRATAYGTSENGATLFRLTLFNQNKVVMTGLAFSGGDGSPSIPTGNYKIRTDIRDATGPTSINPKSPLNNPPVYYGIQRIPKDPVQNPETGIWYDLRYGYGPMRAYLNPFKSNPTQAEAGNYLHGQNPPHGSTHGCLCYGTDTSIIDYLWKLPPSKIPTAVGVPVQEP